MRNNFHLFDSSSNQQNNKDNLIQIWIMKSFSAINQFTINWRIIPILTGSTEWHLVNVARNVVKLWFVLSAHCRLIPPSPHITTFTKSRWRFRVKRAKVKLRWEENNISLCSVYKSARIDHRLWIVSASWLGILMTRKMKTREENGDGNINIVSATNDCEVKVSFCLALGIQYLVKIFARFLSPLCYIYF